MQHSPDPPDVRRPDKKQLDYCNLRRSRPENIPNCGLQMENCSFGKNRFMA
jgi:hypothetical protein